MLEHSAEQQQKIEYIQTIFRLSLVHLAELLGTTRQSLEKWKSGTYPSSTYQQRIEVLYQAASDFEEAGLVADLSIKKRWIDTELEFIQGLAYDKNPIDSVYRLTKLVDIGKKRIERGEWKKRLKYIQPKSILDDLPYHYSTE